MKKLILILTVGILTSCTRAVFVKPDPLPLPPIPQFTHIGIEEFSCLTDETYKKFRLRDTEMLNYIDLLRSEIQATH